MKLDGQAIIITGSTGGIGKAIAQRCVDEGARVVIHGLDESDGLRVVEELGEDRAVLKILDLTEPDASNELVEFAIEKWGGLNALVNNAAIITSGNVHTTNAELFRKVLEVNTISPFLLIQAALPHLEKTKGVVLNIGSVNAWCGEPNLLPYSASKGALATMTRNLGSELPLAAGVRVNQLNPGWVRTENEIRLQRERGAADDWEAQISKETAPAGRIFLPDEIAAVAVNWLSPEIGPVSGQVFEVEQYPMLGRNPPKI